MKEKVAVITGFYKSPAFLKILFDHLANQTFKDFDVYVYNYSHERIKELEGNDYPFKYEIIKLVKNAGFAGGNNSAILEARKNFDYSFYALINDDTKPDKNWLKSLVDLAATDNTIGAVTSKMVFYEKYILLSGKTDKISSGDHRELGVRLYSNTSFENCDYRKAFYKTGFYDEEEDEIYTFRWTDSTFTMAIPISGEEYSTPYKLKLFVRKNSSLKRQTLNLCIGDYNIPQISLSDECIYYEREIPAEVIKRNSYFIIQNAGSNYDKNFNGYDIGSGEVDTGQYDKIKEVNLFCGGACLLSKGALINTGLFNTHFFSYYEDSDLSLRMKKKGYKIVYNPAALVSHYHSATSKEWSPFFTYHVFRNKIIFSSKNFGFKGFFLSFKERFKETWLFFKWVFKNKFADPSLKARLRLNVKILVDSLIGIIKYRPTKF
jgi:GT2 family glycosyltransferase